MQFKVGDIITIKDGSGDYYLIINLHTKQYRCQTITNLLIPVYFFDINLMLVTSIFRGINVPKH